jgi:hypothetical protein
VVKNLSADGVGNAVRSLSPGLRITGGADPRRRHRPGPASRSDGHRHPDRPDLTGIHARATDPISIDTVRVDAVAVGVEAQPGSVVTLRNSAVHALEAVRGTVTLRGINDLSLPPLNLLGAIGLPLIVLAVILELLHLLRQRGFGPRRRTLPPAIAAETG